MVDPGVADQCGKHLCGRVACTGTFAVVALAEAEDPVFRVLMLFGFAFLKLYRSCVDPLEEGNRAKPIGGLCLLYHELHTLMTYNVAQYRLPCGLASLEGPEPALRTPRKTVCSVCERAVERLRRSR